MASSTDGERISLAQRSDYEERLVRGDTGRVFVTVSAGWLFLRMGRELLPPLLPSIVADLNITSVQAGFGLTLLWGTYALSQYPSGRLSDQLSRKTLIVASLVCMIGGFAVISGSITFAVFLLGTTIVGIGTGFYPTTARALVSDIFVERRGQAYGIHGMLGSVGSAIAAGLAVGVLAVASWRAAFLPVIVGAAVVALAFHRWSSESYVYRRADLDFRKTLSRLVQDRQVLLILFAYSLFSFTWQSATSFLPTLLTTEKGFSVGIAGSGFALLFVVGSVAKPISGRLGDRYDRRLVSAVSLFIGMVGLLGIVLAEDKVLALVAVCVFAVGLMAYPPTMIAYLMDVFPTDSTGGDYGAFRTAFLLVGSLGPTYMGYTASVYNYTFAFLTLAGCLVVSSVAIAALVVRGR